MRSRLLQIIDFVLAPVVVLSALVLKFVRRAGVQHMPIARTTFRAIGVFPIEDHYYEPLFSPVHLNQRFAEARSLPSIDWNLEGQLSFLKRIALYADEVPVITSTSFGGADAACWYCLLRCLHPQRVIEVGSGTSTQLALKALERNGNKASHICIEPYEEPWLEGSGAIVLRERLEDVDRNIFRQLGQNDVLFIDSSHVIRPQGDVLTEILEILPSLAPGVIVHFHDIFSPRHYHYKWVTDEVRLWNEQYLLEAFLCCNTQWEILGALNYLKHERPDALQQVCQLLNFDQEPGSIYIRKRSTERIIDSLQAEKSSGASASTGHVIPPSLSLGAFDKGWYCRERRRKVFNGLSRN